MVVWTCKRYRNKTDTENRQEDHPTMEHCRKQGQEDYSTSVAYIINTMKCVMEPM